MAPNEKEEHRHAIVIGHVHLDRCNDATNWDEIPLLFPEKIVDLVTLNRVLPSICSTIFHQIGSQQVEATYQRCLQVDLKAAGIPTVILEPEIHLLYKGQIVGSRRPDILLKLHSGESALL